MDILRIIGGTSFFAMISLFMCAAAWHLAPGSNLSWVKRTDPEVLGFVSVGFASMFVSGLSLVFVTTPGSGWFVVCITAMIIGFIGGAIYGLECYRESRC